MCRTDHRSSAALSLLCLAACSSGQPAQPPSPPPAVAPVVKTPPPVAAPPVAAPSVAVPPAPAAPAPLVPDGQDFAVEAKLLFRVAACTGDDPIPPELAAPVVEEHCRILAPKMARDEQHDLVAAREFISRLRPPGLPTRVVYPFGGGDLISALTTYPDAGEITTLSLEYAGDPRRIRHLDKKQLRESLALLRSTIDGLLALDDSTTENLQKSQHGEIPGQLAFFLVALAVHGFEPVSLRYFRLEPDGALHYLTEEEIAAVEKKGARRLHHKWEPPDHSEAFAKMELTFRQRGAPNSLLRVHRHIAVNLSDPDLKRDPSLLAHLSQKGKVVAMTKAASYLLWSNNFSLIRDYLLQHMAFMISDSTGIPPRMAARAGFVQETYGRFETAFLPTAPSEISEQFREMWAAQPYRKLPFRYGYQDGKRQYHLLVTRPKS
jgi:hypothetical protein